LKNPFAIGIFLLCVASAAAADDWPRWRGPQRNGISREAGWTHEWPEQGPRVEWKAAVGTGFSSVTVREGRLFTMGNANNTDTVYCIDTATGKQLWSHSYECALDDRLFEGGPTSTPSVDDDRVYTLSRQGHLFCFDSTSGDIAWSTNVAEATGAPIPGWGFSSSPMVHGDMLLLNVGEAGTAIDKKTGEVIWKSAEREAGYATPVPFRSGERWLAAIASGKFLIVVELATGNEMWRHRWLTRFGCNAADAIVDGDHVFISSGYNRGAALLKVGEGEPAVVWQNKEMQNQMNASVLFDGHLYGVDGNNDSAVQLKCMEFRTGEVKWAHPLDGLASLTAADGKLIVLNEDGTLMIARAAPERFESLAQARVMTGKCWTVPVLANGRIYCRNADGDLACIDVRK
jgi:outer membrane protein assembly factor BamB